MQSAPRTAEPRDIAALMQMLSGGQLAEAQQRAEALLRDNPEDGMLWKVLGVVLLRQDRDAVAALARAAELLPQDAEAHANLATELRGRGRLEEALAALRQCLSLQPRNPDALIEAAEIQSLLGRPREAVTLYVWALQADPTRRDAHNNLGNALMALGETAEAIRCYQRALKLTGDDSQVLCNLAEALRQRGEFEEAIQCCRRALELNPALSMAHNTLGVLLGARGDRAAAIRSFYEALRHNPRDIEALLNLAASLVDDGRRHEALALCAQAVQWAPGRADAHCALGRALLENRRVDEAAESFRRSIELQPKQVDARLGLAAALRGLSFPEQAEEACKEALALEPRRADALQILGELRADHGDFAGARESFERALEMDSSFAPAYSSIAHVRRMTRNDAGWLAGVKSLLTRPLQVETEIKLRYALGKYHDDVEEYDEAFASFRAANELTRRLGGKHDGPKLTALVSQLTRRFDAALVRTAHPRGNDGERCIFIIGMPRSGTSLTEQILSSHPDVFGAGEVRFWDRAWATLDQVGWESGDREARVAGIADEYLRRVGRDAGNARRIIDKMPANFLYAGLIQAVLPGARFIHMQRHPFDTCLSVYFQHFYNVSPYANDLGDIAHYYGEYTRIMNHWRRILPAEALLEVPYEGLVQETEQWTRRMLEFIDLPWDPRCLEFHNTERVVITASRWQVRQKMNSSSAGRWRHYEKHVGPLRHLLPDV